ncbi:MULTISPECIES: hypothetical protein [Microbacterium]|uniref:hypothetical protein n=1 Tax=Microbacterium TaxID=33882 RepID=UPI002780F116|nr:MULTISPECIES: hypothetical protein [Microbacterium]MDQ1082906.1 hypothetical protein [Microbacterium sp. SORGH_AS_0344]MDQ1168325.1 hypothetical protein [Microbacterium proteolyticum]
MARIGGRSLWLAWPVGLFCLAAVLGLGVLAAPGIPGAIGFVGDTLRSVTSPSATVDAEPATPATECRRLYSQPMWSSLVWSPDALLSQRRTAALSTPEAVAAAQPTTVVTCHWRGVGGRFLETTVSTVSPEGAAAAVAALASQGFACTSAPDASQPAVTHCVRTTGEVDEVHDLRGDRWVSSTLSGWMPDGYAEDAASHAFFGG